jgi:hypothetical protein
MKFEVVFNQAAFKQALNRPVKLAIQDAVFDLRATFAELFGGIKTGRIYPRPQPLTGFYRASAPGEAPAIRTGNLLRSIRESFPEPLTGQITISAPYARYLEEGTARGLAPRPFVRPAIESVTKRFNHGVRGRFS